MASVYRGHDLRLDRDVAIKVLLPNMAADAVVAERFEREARALAAAAHPSVVNVYDVEPGDPATGRDPSTSWSCATAARSPIAWPSAAGSIPPTWSRSSRPSPTGSSTSTAAGSSIATSSRTTSCSRATAPSSRTSASPAARSPPRWAGSPPPGRRLERWPGSRRNCSAELRRRGRVGRLRPGRAGVPGAHRADAATGRVDGRGRRLADRPGTDRLVGGAGAGNCLRCAGRRSTIDRSKRCPPRRSSPTTSARRYRRRPPARVAPQRRQSCPPRRGGDRAGRRLDPSARHARGDRRARSAPGPDPPRPWPAAQAPKRALSRRAGPRPAILALGSSRS